MASGHSDVPNRRPGPNKRPGEKNLQKSISVLGLIVSVLLLRDGIWCDGKEEIAKISNFPVSRQ